MKIGILSTCEHYAWAGTEEVWFHFAELALRSGDEVTLGAHHMVAGSSQVSKLQKLGMKVLSRHPSSRVRLYLLRERFKSEMAALAECDVVVVNAGSLYDALNLPWIGNTIRSLREQGIPVVYFCHFAAESLPATQHPQHAIDDFIGHVTSWVFVSEHNHTLARRQLATNFRRADVVMNGPRLKLNAALPFPATTTWTLGCVARLETRWKGHDVLLECLSENLWRDRNWRLNLYGSGPDEDYLRRLIQHFGLSDRVRLCGYVRDLTDVWSACHAMVLASHGEGTPLAVLEAMMCGRPTITTDVGGNSEILDEGQTGFIADASTPKCFGETLERAWRRRDSWEAIGEAAHQVAVRLSYAEPHRRLRELVHEIAQRTA